MGNTYEILIWFKQTMYHEEQYRYLSVWRGESRKEALKVMDKFAKEGIKCIKLKYRP